VKAYVTGNLYNVPVQDAEAWIEELLCFRMSLQRAMKEQDVGKKKMIIDALDDEVDDLVLKDKAVKPVHVRDLTSDEKERRATYAVESQGARIWIIRESQGTHYGRRKSDRHTERQSRKQERQLWALCR
jgi:hypothetical protein